MAQGQQGCRDSFNLQGPSGSLGMDGEQHDGSLMYHADRLIADDSRKLLDSNATHGLYPQMVPALPQGIADGVRWEAGSPFGGLDRMGQSSYRSDSRMQHAQFLNPFASLDSSIHAEGTSENYDHIFAPSVDYMDMEKLLGKLKAAEAAGGVQAMKMSSTTHGNEPICSEIPHVVVTAELDVHSAQFADSVLRNPIVIMRDFLKHPNVRFENELMQHPTLAVNHGAEPVNVLHQLLDAHGWDIAPQYWMRRPLSQYISYMAKLEQHISSFQESTWDRVDSVHLPQISTATEAEREPLRILLAITAEETRGVPEALTQTFVGWPGIVWNDFQRANKGHRVTGENFKDVRDQMHEAPAARALLEDVRSRGLSEPQMTLGPPPYVIRAEAYTSRGSQFVSVSVGGIVVVYGPLSALVDVREICQAITAEQFQKELTFLWRSSSSFPHREVNAQKGIFEKARRFQNQVLFCSNLDIGQWQQEMKELERCIPSWMWCQGENDVLGLMRQQVEGMNVPQIYLKVPGAWTGGHEENCRFRAVNCNHGPGESEWFAVDAKHAARLRDIVFRVEGVDIYRREGNWFPNCDWFARYGIPYLTGIQRAGDIIILKGSTLHWVRSLGFSSHSSWNFGFLEHVQLQEAYDRYSTNDALVPPLQNLVPMKMLALDVCRQVARTGGYTVSKVLPNLLKRLRLRAHASDRYTDPFAVQFVLRKLRRFITQERMWREFVTARLGRGSDVEPSGAMVVYCENSECNREIFTSYFRCDTCKGVKGSTKRTKPVFMCLRCGVRHSMQNSKHDILYLHKDTIPELEHDLTQCQLCMSRLHPQVSFTFDDIIPACETATSEEIRMFEEQILASPHVTGDVKPVRLKDSLSSLALSSATAPQMPRMKNMKTSMKSHVPTSPDEALRMDAQLPQSQQLTSGSVGTGYVTTGSKKRMPDVLEDEFLTSDPFMSVSAGQSNASAPLPPQLRASTPYTHTQSHDTHNPDTSMDTISTDDAIRWLYPAAVYGTASLVNTARALKAAVDTSADRQLAFHVDQALERLCDVYETLKQAADVSSVDLGNVNFNELTSINIARKKVKLPTPPHTQSEWEGGVL